MRDRGHDTEEGKARDPLRRLLRTFQNRPRPGGSKKKYHNMSDHPHRKRAAGSHPDTYRGPYHDPTGVNADDGRLTVVDICDICVLDLELLFFPLLRFVNFRFRRFTTRTKR